MCYSTTIGRQFQRLLKAERNYQHERFSRWLYANYIKPQLDTADPAGYEQSLSLMDTSLDEALRREYEKILEFYAGNAFLLDLRTGSGLCRDLMYK